MHFREEEKSGSAYGKSFHANVELELSVPVVPAADEDNAVPNCMRDSVLLGWSRLGSA